MQFLFLLEYKTKKQFNSCQKGALRHNTGNSPQDSYGEAKLETANSENSYVRGSFCPTSEYGAVRFGQQGQKIEYWVKTDDDNGDTSEKSGTWDRSVARCIYKDLEDSISGKYYANKCYPFYIELKTECTTINDILWVDIQIGDSNVNLNTGNTISGSECNDYNDCRPFYYGKKCQSHVDEYDEDKQ